VENKICHKCKEDKPLSDFAKNKTRKDGLQAACKICMNAYCKVYYTLTPEKNSLRLQYKVKRKAEILQYIWDYLKEHPCIDCGEADPIVLEFDHIGTDKLFNLSEAASGCFTQEKIDLEISKCEVRCCNCHRKMTAKRGNWYANIIK
jgi:hypothetical protein